MLRAGIACLPFAALDRAAGQDASAVLHRVDQHYNRLSTLRARFVERYAGMGMVREEAGMLLLAKPGRMRWNYDKPAGKVFVMDGRYGWTYTPGDAQAQRVAAKTMDDLRSPLRFLLGHMALKKQLVGIGVEPTQDGFLVEGNMRAGFGGALHVVFQVDAAGRMQSLRLIEEDGAETQFRFSETRENEPIAASVFAFVPPAGVGVVDGLPPI